MMDFNQRVAIVTGGGRGIGRAHALMLASRGCRVVVNDLPQDEMGPARQVVAEIQETGGVAVVNEDNVVGSAAAIVQTAIEKFGQLDIIINNAGSTDHQPFDKLSPKEWRSQVELHLMGAVDLCRAAWPHLKRSGSGRIINTLTGALAGNPNVTNYTAGKGGLMGFSRSLAFEAEPHNITVNCICPNAHTRLQEQMAEPLRSFLADNFQPDHVAAFTAWLAHQDTKITNEMFEVGGGSISRLALAQYPYVRAEESTPEAWAAISSAVIAEGDLIPMSNVVELTLRDIQQVDPDFIVDLGSVLEEK